MAGGREEVEVFWSSLSPRATPTSRELPAGAQRYLSLAGVPQYYAWTPNNAAVLRSWYGTAARHRRRTVPPVPAETVEQRRQAESLSCESHPSALYCKDARHVVLLARCVGLGRAPSVFGKSPCAQRRAVASPHCPVPKPDGIAFCTRQCASVMTARGATSANRYMSFSCHEFPLL